ncbi:restriction endonuclease subunit S [Rothia aeria]|jgi:type I restriction modification DNA specificity family protein
MTELSLGEAFDFNPKVTLQKKEPVPFVEMADLIPEHRDAYSHKLKEYSGGSKFCDGDVLIARITPCLQNGKTSIYRADPHVKDKPAFGSTEFLVLRGKTDISTSFYGYYLFRTQEVRNFAIATMNGSSGRQRVQLDALSEYKINLPNLSTQREIVATLGALDDKIESNRRALKILFELTDEIAKKMLSENEVKVHELGELVAFNKSSIKTGQFAEIDYIDIKSVGQGIVESATHYRFADAPSRARRMVHDGDVIYSTVRPERQAFSPIFMPAPNLIVSTGFAVMSPKEKIGTSFLAYIAGSESFAKYLASAASGSAYPAVSVSAMGKYRVSLPADTTILDLYEQITLPMRRMGAQLLKESQQVESLRDALLPELMSGRIRVPQAQEAIAEVIPEEDDEHASKTSRG